MTIISSKLRTESTKQYHVPHKLPLSSFVLNFLETSILWVKILEVLYKNYDVPVSIYRSELGTRMQLVSIYRSELGTRMQLMRKKNKKKKQKTPTDSTV